MESGRFVGSKDETAGYQADQLTSESNLKIRVPAALEPQFSQYASAIQFPEWNIASNHPSPLPY